MALAGNIKEFGLADIFQIVSLQQKTGVLTVESSQGTVAVLLEKGLIVGANASFRPIEERLEQSLIQGNQLSKFQLKRATENQRKTHQPLWTALAEVGDIDVGVLQRALSQQIHETIYHLLRWTEGNYRFEPRKVEYDQNLVTPINTEFLIMEGFRITDEWSLFEKEIPSLQVLIRRTQGSVSPGDLSETEKKIYQVLESEKTIQDIADIGQMGEFDACQTVYELMKKGWVEKVPGKKGKKVKIRRVSLDLDMLLSKAAMLFIGIAVIIGAVFGVRVLPDDVILIHQPNLSGIEAVKPLATRSYIQNVSYYITVYFFEYGKRPSSLDELVSIGSIPNSDLLRDVWGNPLVMESDRGGVLLRSLGQDGESGTSDDVILKVSL